MFSREWFMLHPHIDLVAKLILGFILVYLAAKFMGRKQIKSYTPFDFIFVLFLGGILEETAFSEDEPFTSMVIAVVVWFLINFILQKATIHSEYLEENLKGKPILIIDNGVLHLDILKQNNMELEQLRQALRNKSIFSVEEVQYAVLEVDGTINVKKWPKFETIQHRFIVPRKYDDLGDPFPVMVVEEGNIVPEEISGVPKEWVEDQLSLLPGKERRNVIYAEKKGNRFYYKTRFGIKEDSEEEQEEPKETN